jgi:fucose 4-O-acetylase-like acetyltransferase
MEKSGCGREARHDRGEISPLRSARNDTDRESMTKARLLFVDNLRTVMIVLVILVHLSVTYGGEGSWFYKERPVDMLTITALSFFNAVTQSYFMGFLFFLAGYFTPSSYDRKGPRQFLRDRLLRLGVPLLVYEFVIHPLPAYPLIKAGVLEVEGSFAEMLVDYYTSFHIGSGPLWFVETLLIFSFVYVAYRLLRSDPPASARRDPPGSTALITLATGLGLATFLVRIRLPITWSLQPLNLQLPFFLQYLCMFPLGIVASRNDWLVGMPRATGRLWLAVAAVLTVVVFPLLFTLGGALQGNVQQFLGGLHWQAFAYAMWEQLLGVATIVGLTVLFREHLNRQGPLAQEAAAGSYTVYIIHAPVVILFTVAVRNVRLYPLLKFALAALIVVPLCFALAAALRRLPLARRIL